ncbi:MAG TPA: histidine phosphatase family protein [Acidimicrobiales bacterium]|nr:histidine phosphatase family protein [Acidimicrobiales bacterium]
MRTLLLLRHAKSSWADPTVPDHDRPLAPRGARAAGRIAVHLRAEGIRPALVLCSSARRAQETLDALRPAFGETTDVRIENELYGADADEIFQRLCAVDGPVRSVMVVGHNPGLEDLATALAGDGDETALLQLHTKFPTGALATLDLRSGWARLRQSEAYLTSLVVPRQLR